VKRFERWRAKRAAGVGAAVTDQLMGVWYSEGVGSGRAIEQLCEWDPAYQWLTGARVVNAHTLSDFRVKHEQALKDCSCRSWGCSAPMG